MCVFPLEKRNSCLSSLQFLMNILSSASFPLGLRTDALQYHLLFSFSLQLPWSELAWFSSCVSEDCDFFMIKGPFWAPDHKSFSFHPFNFFFFFKLSIPPNPTPLKLSAQGILNRRSQDLLFPLILLLILCTFWQTCCSTTEYVSLSYSNLGMWVHCVPFVPPLPYVYNTPLMSEDIWLCRLLLCPTYH